MKTAMVRGWLFVFGDQICHRNVLIRMKFGF